MRQRVFVSITAGRTPREAELVCVTENPRVVDAAVLAIIRCVGRKLDESGSHPSPAQMRSQP